MASLYKITIKVFKPRVHLKIYNVSCEPSHRELKKKPSLPSISTPNGGILGQEERITEGEILILRCQTYLSLDSTMTSNSGESMEIYSILFPLLLSISIYRRLPARRDLFWEDYARSSSHKKVTWIEMIITPKIMAYFWQFSFCIHKNIQVFIWKRLQSQFSLITGEKLRKNL